MRPNTIICCVLSPYQNNTDQLSINDQVVLILTSCKTLQINIPLLDFTHLSHYTLETVSFQCENINLWP